MNEAGVTFACFGSECTVRVLGDRPGASAEEAVDEARRRLLAWHDRFTRFDPSSELARLNADPAEEVPVSADMALLAEAVVSAAEQTGGLVDATLLGEIERAGYRSDLQTSLPLADALRLAPSRRAAAPGPGEQWRELQVDRAGLRVRRPPGLAIDGGGLAKGLFADLLGSELAAHASYAVDCAGDVLLGGCESLPREVNVADPFGEGIVHRFHTTHGGVATSSIGRRSWLDGEGRPAHHLLDPSTGRPAFTGIVQVTALAPSALQAEIRSKAALLSGPEGARRWLPDGGVVVHDDATLHIV